MFIAKNYQGSYGGFPAPEFVFFIGPSPDNPLNGTADYSRRKAEVDKLLAPDQPFFTALAQALEASFSGPIFQLHAEIRLGGMKGLICPCLHINTLRSSVENQGSLYSRVSPKVGERLARALIGITEAAWVTVWHAPYKAFRVDCTRQQEEIVSSFYDPATQRFPELRSRPAGLNIALALDAYRLGDRLGAPWEGQGPTWQPTDWREIEKRSRQYPQGTDESDTVNCFERFAAGYRWRGDKDHLLQSWASYHEEHRAATSYGKTWRDYFTTVKYLRKKGALSVQKLYEISADRNRTGSAGNGALALALPVFAYGLQLGLPSRQRVELVGDVVYLSHASSEAIAAARFLCELFEYCRDPGSLFPADLKECPQLDRYFHGKQTGEQARWFDSPVLFAKEFPQNVLCGGTLVHAIYGVQRASSWRELGCNVVGMRGDVDSVLALAMMLWALLHSEDGKPETFVKL